MPSAVDSGYRTFEAGAALLKYRRVKLSSGLLAYAGDEFGLGTLTEEAFASGQYVSVALKNKPGTRLMVAAGAIAVGALVYAAANGKVDDTASTILEGVALTASSADGDVIEVLTVPHMIPDAIE